MCQFLAGTADIQNSSMSANSTLNKRNGTLGVAQQQETQTHTQKTQTHTHMHLHMLPTT